MSTFQAAIGLLPFVTGQPGAFNLWDPPKTGRWSVDLAAGRWGAASLLHLVRAFNAPFLFFHMNTAWRAAGGPRDAYREGMILELGEAIQNAPDDHEDLLRAAHLRFDPADVKASILSLPGVYQDANGSIRTDGFSRSGSYDEQVAAGKFFGSAICQLVKQTGWTSFMLDEDPAPLSPDEANVMVGIQHVVASVATSSPAGSTPYQRGSLVFFEGAEWGKHPAHPRNQINA